MVVVVAVVIIVVVLVVVAAAIYVGTALTKKWSNFKCPWSYC